MAKLLALDFLPGEKGSRVGEDENGNVYYQSTDDRRWVIYNGPAEASTIPAGWHGWIHGRTDTAPCDETYEHRDWEMPHRQNYTGTAAAYRPKGSIASQEKTSRCYR